MNNEEFEEQLKQEELEKQKVASINEKTRKDEDGTEYEWDEDKQAWFPKIDEDFIANYQLNYGSTSAVQEPEKAVQYTKEETDQYWKDYYSYYYSYYQNTSTDGDPENPDATDKQLDPDEEYKRYLDFCQYYYGNDHVEQKDEDTKEEKDKEGTVKKEAVKRKAQEPPRWFDLGDAKNTNVYVSGLPGDITDQEFSELMNKCGLVMYDPRTRKPMMKLYRDENSMPKGDGRCCYIKKESVDLAMQFLDGSELRGSKICVEFAKFEMKGTFDPSKSKKKLTNKEKKRMKEKQEKLFDWHPDKLQDMRPSHEKVIILKNLFDPADFEKNPVAINDLRDEIRQESSNFGDLKKVVVFDRHEDGVVMVFYKNADDADLCKQSMSGRWFATRRVVAATWDGNTKYDVEETKEEREKRLKDWTSYLDDDGRPTEAGCDRRKKEKETVEGGRNEVRGGGQDGGEEADEGDGIAKKLVESERKEVRGGGQDGGEEVDEGDGIEMKLVEDERKEVRGGGQDGGEEVDEGDGIEMKLVESELKEVRGGGQDGGEEVYEGDGIEMKLVEDELKEVRGGGQDGGEEVNEGAGIEKKTSEVEREDGTVGGNEEEMQGIDTEETEGNEAGTADQMAVEGDCGSDSGIATV